METECFYVVRADILQAGNKLSYAREAGNKHWAREAEYSSLLEAVARERLVKTAG
jgi:hypothetical protein